MLDSGKDFSLGIGQQLEQHGAPVKVNVAYVATLKFIAIP